MPIHDTLMYVFVNDLNQRDVRPWIVKQGTIAIRLETTSHRGVFFLLHKKQVNLQLLQLLLCSGILSCEKHHGVTNRQAAQSFFDRGVHRWFVSCVCSLVMQALKAET